MEYEQDVTLKALRDVYTLLLALHGCSKDDIQRLDQLVECAFRSGKVVGADAMMSKFSTQQPMN